MKRLIAASLFLAAGLPAAERAVAPGLNRFADDCYRELSASHGNLVFSPTSISTALSMTLAGARGSTASAIASVLHQNGSSADYHAAVAALAAELAKKAGGGNQLRMANGLWVQNGFPVLSGFKEAMDGIYGAPLGMADFRGDPEGARRAINSWAERQTQGKLRDLFGPGSLDSSTRLVLASAIYFNGKWQLAFRPADTRPGPFKLPGGGDAQAHFMNSTGNFGYAETPSAQVLEMKYAGSELAFDVLLPKPGSGLNAVEAAIGDGLVPEWLARIENRSVAVALPKFRAEADVSLKETLARLGMGEASGASADFSGIDDRRDLALSTVVHKAFVDVTEEGTEAAAATGVGVALISMRTSPPVTFRADRPFVFLIRDTKSGAVLFMGRLARPS